MRRDREYRELPEEREARRIVAGELGLVVDRFEDGTANGMVDALIRTPFGAVPLEVVQDVNVPERRQAAALGQHGRRIDVPGLVPGWYVTLKHRVNVREVRRQLPGLLLRLDQLRAGRPSWASPSLAMWEQDLPDEFRRIGVEYLAPLETMPGIVMLNGEGWEGSYGDDPLNAWVATVLEREADVPAKLRAFPGGRGDAFIWATISSDLAVTGLMTDPDVAVVPRSLPERALNLPEGVDRVWVACTIGRRRGIVAEGGRWRWLNWVADPGRALGDG